MELFFGKPAAENKIVLDEDESNHLIKVKRARIGDTVEVTDGEGRLYHTRFSEQLKRTCALDIVSVKEYNARTTRLHIAIAPTKNMDRMEWFLEKAVETGIDEVSLLLCRHSERREIKTERLQRVMIAAMKQSLKTYLPKLNELIDFKTFITKPCTGVKLICTTHPEGSRHFKERYAPGNTLTALIGPEGDFHLEELESARQNGYEPASLGTARLRTETAALNVCTLFNFLNSY